MRIQGIKNKIEKRNDLLHVKTDYKDMGNYIKNQRKRQKKTQDEVCEGICSISYLSKIENNQIVPNQHLVKEIMTKLDVKEVIYTKTLEDKKYLSTLLNDFYYCNDKNIEKMYQELNNIEHNYLITLCKLGYIAYNRLDDEFDYVLMLEQLLSNMNDFEVAVYLYFSAIIFKDKQKYRISLELLKLTEQLQYHQIELKALISELMYWIFQTLLNINSSIVYYQDAQNIFARTNNVKRLIHLSIMKAGFLLDENPLYALEILKSIKTHLLDDNTLDLYYYMKAKVNYKLQRQTETLNCLHRISKNSQYYYKKMVLLYELSNELEDLKTKEEIIDILQNVKPLKHDLHEKIKYHYLSMTCNDEKKEYLRDIAIPFSIKIQNYSDLKIYIDDVMDICISNSRYKEAIQYHQKYQKELKKIEQILA